MINSSGSNPCFVNRGLVRKASIPNAKIVMDDYDDLGSYNGDVEHDMWVDYDHYQNTGEPDVFDEEDIDVIVDELNDWD